MKTLLLLVGIIVCAAGILFTGQGLGYINWPASSFMAHVRHYTSGSWGSPPFSQTHDHEVVNCAAEFGRGRDVRFGSNADMCTAASDVRYKAENYDGANPDAATATGQTARATPIFNLIALRQFIYAHEQTI